MQSFLDPAILFFAIGILAGAVKSNLEIPAPISRFLSLYLLMALGLKGGFALAKTGMTNDIALGLTSAVTLAVLIPIIAYTLLKRIVARFDAAAIAATYGSVSAVTFITATQFLDNQHIAYGGHMAAAMAMMESPAILIAMVFANALRSETSTLRVNSGGAVALAAPGMHDGNRFPLGKILHESFTDGAQILLLGAMLIGLLTGEAGKAAVAPFSVDLFRGMLCFFLLDMGLLTARNLGKLRGQSPWLLAYGILAPLCHAGLALIIACAARLTPGDTTLLMALAASASYIAVPAVLRHAMPEAQPSLYFGMSLGLTFPFNILLGIPLYSALAQHILAN